MTKPINLRQARKRKARADTAKQAEANRIAHGMPKSIRDLEAARRDKLAKAVDGHRLESRQETKSEFPDEPGPGEDPGPRSG